MHPLRSGRSPVKSAPAECSDGDSEGPLALWAQWQRGQATADVQAAPDLSHAAQTTDSALHQASVRLGQCFVAWVPGLLGSLLQSFGVGAAQSTSAAESAAQHSRQCGGPAVTAGSSAAKPAVLQVPKQLNTDPSPEQQQAQEAQPPGRSWLAANLVADLSVGSLQVLLHGCHDYLVRLPSAVFVPV